MVRKSRKHPELAVPVSKDTVGYIRLSVLNRDPHGSVENQRFMIEEWGAYTGSNLPAARRISAGGREKPCHPAGRVRQ